MSGEIRTYNLCLIKRGFDHAFYIHDPIGRSITAWHVFRGLYRGIFNDHEMAEIAIYQQSALCDHEID